MIGWVLDLGSQRPRVPTPVWVGSQGFPHAMKEACMGVGPNPRQMWSSPYIKIQSYDWVSRSRNSLLGEGGWRCQVATRSWRWFGKTTTWSVCGGREHATQPCDLIFIFFCLQPLQDYVLVRRGFSHSLFCTRSTNEEASWSWHIPMAGDEWRNNTNISNMNNTNINKTITIATTTKHILKKKKIQTTKEKMKKTKKNEEEYYRG